MSPQRLPLQPLKMMVESGLMYVPLREYRQGHIEGAINIPHSDIGHRIFEYVDDPALPVHLYDAEGVFAGLALEILMEMGFEYVINEGPYQQLLERQDN